MTQNNSQPWLNRFAVLTAVATLFLIGLGGLVTSHEAGLAVPDWPTTYGYNMFLFPISQWIGGIFYEHTHRLAAAAVGLLTVILTVWLWFQEKRNWLRWLGAAAFLLVVWQGVLGGLRVTLYKNEIGIVHATLAQLFLVLVSAIALFTTRSWRRLAGAQPARNLSNLRYWFLFATLLVFIQLMLGATMRHQHAGLAIPDFPLAYGRLWPRTDEASLAWINQHRVDARDFGPVTAFQVALHMTHRLGALVIVLATGLSALQLGRRAGRRAPITKLAWSWLALICLQGLLGAITVWSNKAADIATAHVVLGAASLVVGTWLTLVLFRWSIPGHPAVFPGPAAPWPPPVAAAAPTESETAFT